MVDLVSGVGSCINVDNFWEKLKISQLWFVYPCNCNEHLRRVTFRQAIFQCLRTQINHGRIIGMIIFTGILIVKFCMRQQQRRSSSRTWGPTRTSPSNNWSSSTGHCVARGAGAGCQCSYVFFRWWWWDNVPQYGICCVKSFFEVQK